MQSADDALTVPLPSWARTLRELNVRQGRSKKAQVVRLLAIGEDVHIVDLSGMRAQIDSPCDGWISTMTSAKEVCLELPDGPWPLPDLPDAPGAAAAGTMSQENEDAVSLYDPPLIRPGWAMTLVQVNVREGRSKRSELLGSLPVKTRIYILEVVETRARINDPYEGWVSVLTPERLFAVEPLEVEEEPPGVEDVPPPPPPPPPVEEPAEGPSEELPPPNEELPKQKELRIVEAEPTSPSSSEDSDSSGSTSSDSSEAQSAPKAQAKPTGSAPPAAPTSSEDSASDSSTSESSQATSSSSPVKPAAVKPAAEDSAPVPVASGENSPGPRSEEPGWWWTHLKAIVSKGESRLTEVVGQIPPGTTVFVLELRNERAFIREPFEGWTSLRSPSGQIVLSMEAPAHVEGDGDAHTAEAEAKAAEAETKSVEVSTPVPGRLHRAPRKSGMEPVQAVQAVDEPQVERVEDIQMAKPEMELEENQDVEAVKEEKLEELDDAKSEQKTVKTGLLVDHDETKTLKMPKDGKDSTIPAVRVWEPDTFDQDVDELKKRFQKASQQADASKSRETPQLADPVVDTSTARSDARLDATQVVDLPGSAVEPGTEDAKGLEDPPVDPPADPLADPLATAVATTAVATTTSELRPTPVEAEVGGSEAKDSPPGAGDIQTAVAETTLPPVERMETERPEEETPVVQKDKDLQPEWQVEQDSLLRRLEEQLKRVEDPTADLGAIAWVEPGAPVSTLAETMEGAVPATFAAVATVPAIAAPSELVPPHPSDTSDPWPSLRLFGDEDVEQVATELLRRAADEEWRRGRGGVGSGQMPPVETGETSQRPYEPRPDHPGTLVRVPESAARRPKRDEPRSGPIPAWVYEGPSPDASPSSPPVVPRPRASPTRTAASSPGGDAHSRTGGRSGGGNGGIAGIGGTGENMLRGPPQTDSSSGLVELQQLLKLQEQQLRRQVQLQEQQFQLQEMQLQQQEQQLQARRQEQQQQERLNEMRQNLKVLEQQDQRQRVVPKAPLPRQGMPMSTSMLTPAAMQLPLEQQHQQQDLLSHILLLHQSAQLQQLRQVQTEQERHLRELQQLQPPRQPDSSFGGYGNGRPSAAAETSPQIPLGGASGSGSGGGGGSAAYEESPAEMEEEPEEATELTQSASDASDLWHGLWRQHQERPPSEFMASERSKLASQSQVTSWSPTPTPSRSSAP